VRASGLVIAGPPRNPQITFVRLRRFQPPSEPGAGSYRSDLDRGSPGNRSVVAASLLLRPSAPNVQHDNDYDDAHQDEQVSKSIRTSHLPDPPLTPSFRQFPEIASVPDNMPQAITVTDLQGRWAVYVPLRVNGKIVVSDDRAH
jgi:hypothetical protein